MHTTHAVSSLYTIVKESTVVFQLSQNFLLPDALCGFKIIYTATTPHKNLGENAVFSQSALHGRWHKGWETLGPRVCLSVSRFFQSGCTLHGFTLPRVTVVASHSLIHAAFAFVLFPVVRPPLLKSLSSINTVLTVICSHITWRVFHRAVSHGRFRVELAP